MFATVKDIGNEEMRISIDGLLLWSDLAKVVSMPDVLPSAPNGMLYSLAEDLRWRVDALIGALSPVAAGLSVGLAAIGPRFLAVQAAAPLFGNTAESSY